MNHCFSWSIQVSSLLRQVHKRLSTYLHSSSNKVKKMANSRFEYVREFETFDKCLYNSWIVVSVSGNKPLKGEPCTNDSFDLSREVAANVMREHCDILLAIGQRNEFRFVFRQSTEAYNRRGSKLLTTVTSLFTSSFTFHSPPNFNDTPIFNSKLFTFPTNDDVCHYLSNWCAECSNLENTDYPVDISHKVVSEVQTSSASTKGGDSNGKITLLTRSKSEKSSKKRKLKSEDNLRVDHIDADEESLCAQIATHLGVENCTYDSETLLDSKQFEVSEKCLFNCWIVVRLDGKGFHRFTDEHDFEKPNDGRGLRVMNLAAETVMRRFPHLVLAYGQSDEYSFVLKRSTNLADRNASDLMSLIASQLSSAYVHHWSGVMTDKVLRYPPSFDARVVLYPNDKTLRDYLSWRQADCHINNLYNTCFWYLVQKAGKSRNSTQKLLKDTFSKDKKELLLTQFDCDYDKELEQFRKGTVLIREAESSKCSNGDAIKTMSCDIIEDFFWTQHPHLLVYDGERLDPIGYAPSDRILPNTWIVVCVDGKDFKGFSRLHSYTLSNDGRGLDVMNRAAEALMREFGDIVLAYGHSDKYSFVFKPSTNIKDRLRSSLVTTLAARFTCAFVLHWSEVFTENLLSHAPTFQARLFHCPNNVTLRHYLTWRHNQCHLENLYNTCYWKLVQESGLSSDEAVKKLRGTGVGEKNELLFSHFNCNYNKEPEIFKKGTLLLRQHIQAVDPAVEVTNSSQRLNVFHVNLLKNSFWKECETRLHFDFCSGYVAMPQNKLDYIMQLEMPFVILPQTWILLHLTRSQSELLDVTDDLEPSNRREALMSEAAGSIATDMDDIVYIPGHGDTGCLVIRPRGIAHVNGHRLSEIVSAFSGAYTLSLRKTLGSTMMKQTPIFNVNLMMFTEEGDLRTYLALYMPSGANQFENTHH